MKSISEGEYLLHCEDYDGFCTVCQDFTRFGSTEPDAESYPCEECGGDTCVGTENALIMGLIDISEDDDSTDSSEEDE